MSNAVVSLFNRITAKINKYMKLNELIEQTQYIKFKGRKQNKNAKIVNSMGVW